MQKLIFMMLAGGVLVGATMPGKQVEVPATGTSGVVRDSRPEGRNVKSATSSPGAITLERSPDGHFYADVEVNGRAIHFLIDTGASGIALSAADADRASVRMSGDLDEVVGRGAGGDVRGEFVTLESVSLGGTEVRNADAVVLNGGEQSLLGQSFLAEFGSLSIDGDRMVLR